MTADTLKWLYSLLYTFLDWSSSILEALQTPFAQLITKLPDNAIFEVAKATLLAIVEALGIADFTILQAFYGVGFVTFLILIIIRWFRSVS